MTRSLKSSRDLKPPVELRFWWPHEFLKRDPLRHLTFVSYVQFMVNRLLVGGVRYGPANRHQQYADRAIAELKVYKKTGNQEHLINASNYGFLEMQAPSVDGVYFDNGVDSATRKRFGV